MATNLRLDDGRLLEAKLSPSNTISAWQNYGVHRSSGFRHRGAASQRTTAGE